MARIAHRNETSLGTDIVTRRACCAREREKKKEREREKTPRGRERITRRGRNGGTHACAHVREISRSRAMDSVTRAATRVLRGIRKLRPVKMSSVKIRKRLTEGSEFAVNIIEFYENYWKLVFHQDNISCLDFQNKKFHFSCLDYFLILYFLSWIQESWIFWNFLIFKQSPGSLTTSRRKR